MRSITLGALFFLFSAASAYNVSISADTGVRAYETWNIDAFVSDGSGSVNYPDCTMNITKNGQLELTTQMISLSDRAQYSTSFTDTSDRHVVVSCYGAENTTDLSISTNSKLRVTLGAAPSVGGSIKIVADYTDIYDSDISSAGCSARLYANDIFKQTIYLGYDYGENAYIGWASVSESGPHRVSVDCSAGNYIDASSSANFEVSKLPVTITPTTTSIIGNFGDTSTLSMSVYPSTASCSSTYGQVSKTYSNFYSLKFKLGFVGKKTVVIDCSAPEYTSSSKSITVTSNEAPTKLNVGFSSNRFFSFQTFSVKPNYYDAKWNPINNAPCTLTLNNQTRSVNSFEAASFKAPPGPKETGIKVTCSKFGYKKFSGNALFKVSPISFSGNLNYPPDAKEKEGWVIAVALYPKIKVNCTLKGKLNSVEGVVEDMKKTKSIEGEGAFNISFSSPGEFAFDVACSSLGYTEWKGSGKTLIKVFSRNEEVQATILLTILTVILAAGFVLIRKWI